MPYYSRNTSVTVGTSVTELSDDKTQYLDTTRISIILVNTSTGGQNVTIAIDGEAVAGQGIVLYPGGTWNDSQDGIYLPTQARITAIASAAGATIAIQERLN